MTNQELMDGACRIYERFNELLYEFQNKSTDTIPNLSDIKQDYDDIVGKNWNSSSTYKIGDIVTYEFVAYVSLTNSNSGNTPADFPLEWSRVETNTCEEGSVYVAAGCSFLLRGYNFSSSFIIDSFNIESIAFQGNRTFEVTFADSINLFDNSYLVFNGGENSDPNGSFNPQELSFINILNKSRTGFIFQCPDELDSN